MTFLLAQDAFNHWAPIGVLLLMALAFGIGNLIATRVIGPNRTGPVKGLTYESGMDPIGDTHRRFNVRFYIVAMTFLVFDVEIVFLYPWAITYPSLGPTTQDPLLQALFLGRMLFFILTSIIAFAYAWRKGVFRYD